MEFLLRQLILENEGASWNNMAADKVRFYRCRRVTQEKPSSEASLLPSLVPTPACPQAMPFHYIIVIVDDC